MNEMDRTPTNQQRAPHGPPTPTPPFGWLRRLLFGLVVVLGLAVGLLLVAGTGPVLRLAMPRLQQAVSAAADGHLAVDGLRGSLWTGLGVDSLSLSLPATGLAVEGRGLELHWSPFALLQGTVQLDRLAAAHLAVSLPGSPGPAQAQEPSGGLPALPLAIRLDRLDLPEVVIVEPRSGRRFAYALTASAAVGKRAAGISLQLTPRAEESDRLAVELAFDTDRRELQAAIDGRLNRTGLVMTLAGMAPEEAADVTLRLSGTGPADAWRGELHLAASEVAELAGNLGLTLNHRRLGFTFAGSAATLARLSAGLPAALQGQVDINLAGGYEDEKLSVTSLKLSKPGFVNLGAEAEIDLAAKRLAAKLQAHIDSAAGSLTAGAASWQGLELSGEAQGDLLLPDLRLTLAGQAVTTPAFTSRDLSFSLQTTARGKRLDARLQGTAQGTDWAEPRLAALLGRRLELGLEADMARNFKEMTITDLNLAAAGLQLTGRGRLAGNGAVSAAAVTADIADLAVLSPLTAMALQGAGRLTLGNGAWDPAGGGRAELEITARQLALGQADLDRLTGPQPEIAGRLVLSPRRDLAVTLDRIDMAQAGGALSLALTDDFTRLAAAGQLAVLPGALPPGIGLAMPETARLGVRLDGPVQSPAGEIELAVPAIEAGGERIETIAMKSTLNWSAEAVLSLLNQADFTLRGKPYRLAADLALPADRLQVPRLHLTGEGLELTGQLELPGYGPPLRGAVNLVRLDAAMLREWAGPVTAGQAAGTIDFRPEGDTQGLTIAATVQGLQLAGGPGRNGLDRLELTGRIADAFGQPAVELQLTAADIAAGQATLDRLQAALDGPLANLRATVETTGQLQARKPQPVSLAATADLALGDEIQANIVSLTAGIGPEKIALRRPLRLKRSAAGAIDSRGGLAIGAGSLDTTLSFVPDRQLSATAELSGIALGPWAAMFAGQDLAGILALSLSWREQAGQAPQADLTGAISDIRLAQLTTTAGGAGAGKTPPLALQLEADLAAGRLEGRLSAGGATGQLLTARAELPLAASLLAGQFALDPQAPLTGQAEVDGEIGQFWPYVPLPDHSLCGRLKLAAALSGTLAGPELTGTLHLTDGRYEHLQFGTLLQHIRLDGRFDPGGAQITEIAADDGGKGSLTGKAEITTAAERPPAYRATLTMRNMALTRMDELQLFGDIDLNIAGDDRRATIGGMVKVDRGEVDLAVALPPSVPQLTVDNLPPPGEPAGRQGSGRQPQAREDQAPGFAADLQVAVEIPGRLFVRGKGLDSEWDGHLDITGPAASPKLVGRLQARRGQLDVIGKTFVIRDSQISFLGGQPPDPQLDIVGIHTAGDLEVKASMSGTASKSTLTLSSTPELPQDEILSRILFGKSQSKLSAYEAVQLAGVAAELTGTGGGLNIIGTFRRALRMDVLRVEGGEAGPSVEVGKYLTEGVYVGTKRGATADTSGVEVEIDLTPHLKATSESNQIDNKAGLQFKWDY